MAWQSRIVRFDTVGSKWRELARSHERTDHVRSFGGTDTPCSGYETITSGPSGKRDVPTTQQHKSDGPVTIHIARYRNGVASPAKGDGIKPRVERSETLGNEILKSQPPEGAAEPCRHPSVESRPLAFPSPL